MVIDEVVDRWEEARDSRAQGHLEAPRAGSERPSFVLELGGWAFHPSSPSEALDVLEGGRCLYSFSTERDRPDLAEAFPGEPHAGTCGFGGLLGGTALPRSFVLVLEVVLADGRRLPMWEVRGRRRSLVEAKERPPSVCPLLINTLGRTGSVWLTHLLAQHPEIVAYRPFDREPRIGGYWFEALHRLSDPASYLGALSPREREPRWWLGEGQEARLPPPEDEEVERVLGQAALEDIAALCRRRTYEAYGAFARLGGKPAASWCVEKSLDYEPASLWHLWDELHPHSREVMLVRDPRDVLCSQRAYDERRGRVGFGRGLAADDREFLEGFRVASSRRRARHQALGDRSMVVRYEDLVERPHEVVRAVFDHLSVDCSPRLVDEVVARASRETAAMRNHRTAEAPADSIGRWRRDMPEELGKLAEEILSEELEELGYSA